MSNQIRIDMYGKLDKDGHKYYATCDPMPAMIDLSAAIILIFPWSEDGEFGAEMVIKHRDINHRGPRRDHPNAVPAPAEKQTDPSPT